MHVTGKDAGEVLEAARIAVEIQELADEISSYSASAGGLGERERCRVLIEEKAKTLVRMLQQ